MMKKVKTFKTYQLIFPILILSGIFSCQNSNENFQKNDITNEIDTLYFTEDMRGTSGLNVHYTIDSSYHKIPREIWIDVSLTPKGEMNTMIQHFDIYLKSSDSNFIIQQNSNLEYQFFVSNEYKGNSFNGYLSDTDNVLQFEIYLQPLVGYVFKTYWRDNPYTSEEITKLCLKSEQLESI